MRGRAGGRERGIEAGRRAGGREPGTWERTESEDRGMERRAARACLALLWGCALVAAAVAQGKEGECASGCRTLPGRDPRPARASSSGARRAARSFGNRLGAAKSGALRSRTRAGCRGHEPGIRTRILVATGTEGLARRTGLGGRRWGRGAGHGAAAPAAASGTRPAGGRRVPWREGRPGGFSVAWVRFPHLRRWSGERISVEARLFGEGAPPQAGSPQPKLLFRGFSTPPLPLVPGLSTGEGGGQSLPRALPPKLPSQTWAPDRGRE